MTPDEDMGEGTDPRIGYKGTLWERIQGALHHHLAPPRDPGAGVLITARLGDQSAKPNLPRDSQFQSANCGRQRLRDGRGGVRRAPGRTECNLRCEVII